MQRAKITALPQEVTDALNARLVDGGFSNYTALTDWLLQCGYEISRSALHRHGQALEAEFNEAIHDARRTRALIKASKMDEDNGELMTAATEILQDKLLRVSISMSDDEESTASDKAKLLSTVSKAFADVGRLDIARQKWKSESQKKLTDLEGTAAKRGLDSETLRVVREEIYG